MYMLAVTMQCTYLRSYILYLYMPLCMYLMAVQLLSRVHNRWDLAIDAL